MDSRQGIVQNTINDLINARNEGRIGNIDILIRTLLISTKQQDNNKKRKYMEIR